MLAHHHPSKLIIALGVAFGPMAAIAATAPGAPVPYTAAAWPQNGVEYSESGNGNGRVSSPQMGDQDSGARIVVSTLGKNVPAAAPAQSMPAQEAQSGLAYSVQGMLPDLGSSRYSTESKGTTPPRNRSGASVGRSMLGNAVPTAPAQLPELPVLTGPNPGRAEMGTAATTTPSKAASIGSASKINATPRYSGTALLPSADLAASAPTQLLPDLATKTDLHRSNPTSNAPTAPSGVVAGAAAENKPNQPNKTSVGTAAGSVSASTRGGGKDVAAREYNTKESRAESREGLPPAPLGIQGLSRDITQISNSPTGLALEGANQLLQGKEPFTVGVNDPARQLKDAGSRAIMEALRTAVRRHPDVLARKAAIEAAQADLTGSKWQFFPTPQLTAEQSASGDSTRTTTLRLQQPIWTGGALTAGVKTAEAKKRSAELSLRETEETVGLRFMALWTEYVRQSQATKIREQSVDDHKDMLVTIERRNQAGVAVTSDVELAKARLDTAVSELTTARLSLANVGRQLEQQYGGKLPPALIELPPALAVPGLENIAQQVVNRSPALERLRNEEKVAEYDIDTKQAAFWPQIYARAEKQWSPTTGNNTDRAYLTMQSSLGAGMSTASSVDASAARLKAIQEQTRSGERSLRDQISNEYASYSAAKQRYMAHAQVVRSTASVLESFKRQFVAGRRGWSEVLNQVRELSSAELTLGDARVDYITSSWRLWVYSKGLME